MPFKNICAISLLFGALSACKPELDKPHRLMAAEASQTSGLHFKKRFVDSMHSPDSLSIYVCNGVNDYIQDRTISARDFSYAYMHKVLGELPASLQLSYATCYLEQDLKREGFDTYFREGKGFLALEALAGYKEFMAVPQAKLLTRAHQTYREHKQGKLSLRRTQEIMAQLDALWRQQSRRQLRAQRGGYMRRMLDAGQWPVSK